MGLAWLARQRAKLLVSLGLVVAAYVGPYALSQQLGGQGPPVRPMLAILWVLAPALGVALAGGEVALSPPREDELADAARLAREKYGTDEWTFRR